VGCTSGGPGGFWSLACRTEWPADRRGSGCSDRHRRCAGGRFTATFHPRNALSDATRHADRFRTSAMMSARARSCSRSISSSAAAPPSGARYSSPDRGCPLRRRSHEDAKERAARRLTRAPDGSGSRMTNARRRSLRAPGVSCLRAAVRAGGISTTACEYDSLSVRDATVRPWRSRTTSRRSGGCSTTSR
jgi:hypothetical protein